MTRPQVELGTIEGEREGVVAVGIPVFSTAGGLEVPTGLPARMAGVDVPGEADPAWNDRRGFKAKPGQTLVLQGRPGAPLLVLVGLGRRDQLAVKAWRGASAAFVRAAGKGGTGLLVLPAAALAEAPAAPAGGPGTPAGGGAGEGVLDADAVGAAVAEGAILAGYRFDAYRTEGGENPLDRLVVASAASSPGVRDALSRGLAVGAEAASATCFARDLVNEPASCLTPRVLAERVSERLGDLPGVTVEVWDRRRIEAERLGGLLGVARGSEEEPCLVRATYEPSDPVAVEGRVPHLVLVGKGITFDSGGLSLKSGDGMMTMKTDMGGAAAVLSALSAAGRAGVRVRLTAIAAVTENMPSGRAMKPGDVLTARNGKTIEVLNTDAEGRLVLADALSLAVELGPDAIVDVATLTGACIVALGRDMAGVLANDDGLLAQVQAAAERSGEPVWQLPLNEDYRDHIDSEIADMKNMGKSGQAGTISAALLLKEFVDDVPWAHLDIAGPARSDQDSGIFSKGGTGFGTRLLLALASSFTPPRAA